MWWPFVCFNSHSSLLCYCLTQLSTPNHTLSDTTLTLFQVSRRQAQQDAVETQLQELHSRAKVQADQLEEALDQTRRLQAEVRVCVRGGRGRGVLCSKG